MVLSSGQPPWWWIILEWFRVAALATATIAMGIAAVIYTADTVNRVLPVAFGGIATYLGATFAAPDLVRATVASFRAPPEESNRVFVEGLRVDRSSPIWLPRQIQNVLMIGWAVVVIGVVIRILPSTIPW